MACPEDCRHDTSPVECRPCRVGAGPGARPSPLAPFAHDWAAGGWGRFDPLVMTEHGTQQFVESVVDGRGRLVGPVPDAGSLRVAYRLPGTRWADSTVRSLIWGPTAPWSGNNAQQGHLHRVREVSPGMWEAIAVWTSVVFGGDYRSMHVNGVRFSGGSDSLLQGSGAFSLLDTGDPIDHRVTILARQRADGEDTFQVATPERVRHWGESAEVLIEGAAGFDQESVAVDVVTADGLVTVPAASGGSEAWALAAPGATIEPVNTTQRRWAPYWLATQVQGGTTDEVPVAWKRWRYGDPEPDWGDPVAVTRSTVASNQNVPELAIGAGSCALWGAHFYDGSGGEWGPISAEPVGAG